MDGIIKENNMVEVDGKLIPLSKHAKKDFNVGDKVTVRTTQSIPDCDPTYCEGDETCIQCYKTTALVFYPLNCKVEDRIETLETIDNLYVKGDEGTVVNIVGYGIDIVMDSGIEIRVINSDFPKYYNVI